MLTLKAANGGSSTGILGLIIGAGIIYGIIAIWKYKPKKPNENKDIYKLNKN